MFKKPEQALLIVITLLFAGILAGVFIGRHAGKDEIWLNGYESTVSEQTHTEHTVIDTTGKLNINFANEKELAMLPGIGETNARRIVEHRENNGPFVTITDLLNVKGIGQKRFDAISKYITVGG